MSDKNIKSTRIKKKIFFLNPLSKVSKVSRGNIKKKGVADEFTDGKQEYAYAEVVSMGDRTSTRHVEGNGQQRTSQNNTGTDLYHEVGPDAGLTSAKFKPSEKPEGYYHVLEETLDVPELRVRMKIMNYFTGKDVAVYAKNNLATHETSTNLV